MEIAQLCSLMVMLSAAVYRVQAVPPNIIQPTTPTYSLQQGTILLLKCEDTDSDPLAWTKDGAGIVNGVNGFTTTSRTITVNRKPVSQLDLQKQAVTANDFGNYACRSSNNGELDSVGVSITTGCTSNPCLNGASCVPGATFTTYTCNCYLGYTGINCQTEINECASNPCQHGATCMNKIGSFSCSCTVGYTDLLCQTEIDECASNPCQNGGKCNNNVGSYFCNCPVGYTDSRCQTLMDLCANYPCANGGSCVQSWADVQCNCLPRYAGKMCENKLSVCYSNPCLNNGLCNSTSDVSDVYTCACRPNTTGGHCEIAIGGQLCASNPCMNGGACGHIGDNITCICGSNYNGTHCENQIAGFDKDDSKKIALIVILVVGGTVAIIAILIVACCCCRKKKSEKKEIKTDVAFSAVKTSEHA